MTSEVPAGRDPAATLPDLLHDLSTKDLLQLTSGERLWRLFIFRPLAGRATRLEHRIYTKIKSDGHLAMVSFAVPLTGWRHLCAFGYGQSA